MKTKVNRHRVGTIEEFADEFGLTLHAYETNEPADSDERFKAYLDGGQLWITVAGMSLPSVAKGRGNTPEVAIAYYARHISGERFVRSSDGKSIQVWRLDEKPAEEPTTDQPEIADCPVCGCGSVVMRTVPDGYYVSCDSGPSCVRGPVRRTAAEAIAAWHKLTGRE
jgi:hypothetical protein